MSSLAALRVARTAVPRRVVQARSFHSTNPAKSNPTGDNWHLPFWQPPNTSKAVFATKLTAYLGIGFVTPFIACYYQLNKAK